MPVVKSCFTLLSATSLLTLFASASHAGLVPLPGTILASTQSSGTILQYDALTGAQVGSLQVTIDGQPADVLQGIDVLGDQIMVGAARQFVGGGTGVVDPATGTIVFVTTALVPTAFDHLNDNNFITGDVGRFRGVYNSSFQLVEVVEQIFAPGTYSTQEFRGVAGTSTGFATTYQPYFDEIQLWARTGAYLGVRSFNNDDFGSLNNCLEFDAATNAFWFGEAGISSTSRIKRYNPTSPNAEWTASLPGYLTDLAYIPIPSPHAVGLFAVSSLALATRRRR